MPRFVNILLLILFQALGSRVSGQVLKFEQYTSKDGLLSDEVYNLHQDKKGYIWIFTHYGPMKYNGREFVPVLKNLPFKESVIYAIYENNKGRKWIANSNKNIYEIINDSAFAVEGTQQGSAKLRAAISEVYQLYVDDSLNIYVKTTLRTSKFSRSGPGTYRLTDLNDQFAKEDGCDDHILTLGNELMTVTSIAPPTMSYVLRNRLLRFHNETGPLARPGIVFPTTIQAKHCKRFGNKVYINFLNDMIRVAPDGNYKKIDLKEQALNFTMDRRGHLWLACYRGGLLELDENDSVVNRYFEGKTIHDVLADSHNGLWVSTDGSGVYHCKNIDESYYQPEEPFGKPVNFIKTIQDKLFIGTTDFNVSYIENGKVRQVKKINNSLFDDPLSIYFYKPYYLLSYRLHYEVLCPDASGKLYAKFAPPKYQSHKPLSIVAYADHSMLFLGRNRIGILRNADELMKSSASVVDVFTRHKSFCIAQSGKEILVGTDNGVFCFQGDSLFRPPYLEGTKNTLVTRIVNDSLGNVWFCTRGDGLLQLNSRRELLHYTAARGLSSNIVNDVSFLEDGSFLVSGNKGLYYYKGFSKAALSSGRRLLDGEAQSALLFDDKIYVGTKNGLVTINKRFLQPPPPSFFNLSAIYVNDKQTGSHEIGALSYRRNNLRFKFDVLSFSEEKRALKYVLYNATIDSGMVNEDEVDLKRLAPGSYTLAVSLGNAGARQEIRIPFTIVPAFWQTAWFLVLMIFSGLALIVAGGWVLFRYYKARALRKSEAEKLIAEYRLIALKAQINPHFMSNCIAAIQHLILQNKVNEANEYLAKFSFLVRQVLNLSNKSLVPLKEEIEIIELYVKLEKLRFDKIAVEFQVDPAIDARAVFIPPLISQPIIENAIWHGLLPLGPGKTPLLSLSIKQEAGTIRIVIEDNGVGRGTAGKSIGNSRESKGIAITRQRIENLKYISGQDLASLSYEDLSDAAGAPTGTRVTISLPDNLHI